MQEAKASSWGRWVQRIEIGWDLQKQGAHNAPGGKVLTPKTITLSWYPALTGRNRVPYLTLSGEANSSSMV